MNNVRLAVIAAVVCGGSVLPMTAPAAQIRHKTLKSAAAGVAAYEMAKHSHSRFARKHAKAIGIASAIAAHHYMKKHDRPRHHS